MFTILGSGFGLYGYLPALVSGCAQRVVLPERYRPRFAARPELQRFASSVQWKSDEASSLAISTGAAIALRPMDQAEWISRCLAPKGVRHLVLEKPLAPDPESAAALHDRLIAAGKAFRIGYTFRHTGWGSQMIRAAGSRQLGGRLRIRWEFMAHHFRHDLDNWKRHRQSGGGVIRFYGIHVIALLAEAGYRDVIVSLAVGAAEGEEERWAAVLSGPGLPDCEVSVDARSPVSRFAVETTGRPGQDGGGHMFWDESDPFSASPHSNEVGELDARVGVLTDLCQSVLEKPAARFDWYAATISVWELVERRTEYRTAATRSDACS